MRARPQNADRFRIAFIVALLLLPAITIFNVVVAAVGHGKIIRLGRALSGVERAVPITFSLAAIGDGSFQKAVTARIGFAMPTRPSLIRINNELRYALFDTIPIPGIVKAGRGELFELQNITEYCGRTENQARLYADNIAPRLLAIQSYYRSRGAAFIYLITPSKAANLAEDFLGRVPCRNLEAARTQLVPQYAAHLREAGINLLDLATSTHSLRKTLNVDMFPRTGTHWNALAAAYGSQDLMAAINRQTGTETIRPFRFSYAMSNQLSGLDRDIQNLFNLMLDPAGDLVPRVNFDTKGTCDGHGARDLRAYAISGSFQHQIAEVLIKQGCLAKLRTFFYMSVALFEGAPSLQIRTNLTTRDFEPLRDAEIVIVEENETLIGRSRHVEMLYRYLTGGDMSLIPQSDTISPGSPPQQPAERAAHDGTADGAAKRAAH